MKKAKTDNDTNLESLFQIPLNELDKAVVDMISALKKPETLYAVGSISNTQLTTELKELLLFVGISSKQSGNRILFAWTEAIKSNNGWPDDIN